MRVRRVEIISSAGIDAAFAIEDFDAQLTVIEGRNESGKSTLAGAIRALLWPERHHHLRARGIFEAAGATHRSFVDAHAGGWQGEEPTLPDESAGRGIVVGIGDLWADDAHDEAIRQAMTRELHGGFDLRSLHEAARAKTPTAAKREAEQAERRLGTARSEATVLMARESRLPELRERARACRERAARGDTARHAIERLDAIATLTDLRAQLARVPHGSLRVNGDEDQRLREIAGQIEDESAAIEHERTTAAESRDQLDGLALPADGIDEGDLAALATLESELLGLDRQRVEAQRRVEELQAAIDAAPASMRSLDDDSMGKLEAALNKAHEARERRSRDRVAAEAPSQPTAPGTTRPLIVITIALVVLAGMAAGFERAWIALALSAASLVSGLVLFVRTQPSPDRSNESEKAADRSDAAYQAAIDEVRTIAGDDESLLSTLAIATAADRAKRLDAKQLDLHAARASVESIRSQQGDALRRALDLLSRYGHAECEGIGDLSRMRADLERRGREHERLTRVTSEANRLREQAEQRLARAMQQRHALLGQIGLPEDRLQELSEWLRLRDEAHAIRDQIRRHEAVLERLDAAIADAPELLELDRTALEERSRACEAAANEADELREQIGEIEGQIRIARIKADVGEALADLERAAERVAAVRDEECAKAARRLILEHAVASVQGDDVPAIVRHADQWLARFTANAYGLRIEQGQPVVYDLRSGREKEYDELSTGTRAQALLAMRLAGAMDAERRAGVSPLPLILDEPLATTDDARFEAVCQSVFELAREGRQLVYLTCDPGHAARLERLSNEHALSCTRLNLDEIRGRHAAARVPASALLEHKPGPSPETMSREAYLGAIGVGPLDPWRGVETVDLYYVLRDDLATLHALRQREVSTVGQLLARPELVDRPEIIDACRCAQRLITVWRRGRSRPVTPRDILDSGAVSERYIDAAIELNDAVGRSAAALLEAIDRGEIKGFRSNKAAQLRVYLAEQGLLPDALPFTRAELLAEALRGDVIGTSNQDASPMLAMAKGMLDVLDTFGTSDGEALAEQRA